MSKVVRIMELLFIFIFPSTSTMWWNSRQMQAKWPSAGKRSPILCQNDVLQSLPRHLLWIRALRREGRGKNPAHLSAAHSPDAPLRGFHHRPRSISQCLPQNKNAKVRGIHGAGDCISKGKSTHGEHGFLDVSRLLKYSESLTFLWVNTWEECLLLLPVPPESTWVSGPEVGLVR